MVKNKYLYFLLAFFLITRIAIVLSIGPPTTQGPAGDSAQYSNYAVTVLEGSQWLHSANFKGGNRAPGYPLFIALAYFLFGKENLLAVYILQAFVSTITALVIYKLALKVFDRRSALVAFLWAGLYGYYLFYPARILRETLVFFFVVLFFYLLYVCLTDTSFSKKKVCIIALVFTLLIHVSFYYLYSLIGIGILFVIYKGQAGVKKYFLLFVTAIVVLSTPWAIRDYRVHNKIVIANIFTFDPRTASLEVKDNKKEDIHSVTNIKKEYKCDINQSYPTEGERELIKKGFNPNNRTKNELWAIKRDVYPLSTYWGRKWQSLRELWRVYMLGGIYTPYPVCNFKSWSIERNLASIVCYGTLLPFTLIGMLSLVNKRRKDVWFFFIPVLFHTIFYTLSWGSSRFRVPIDFFLIILGGYGIVFVYDFFVVKLFKRTKTT